jgi:hypothetical protein
MSATRQRKRELNKYPRYPVEMAVHWVRAKRSAGVPIARERADCLDSSPIL